MVSLRFWLCSLLALPLALAGHGERIPRSYIIELSDSQTSADKFVTNLNRNGIAIKLDRDLSFSLFHGGSFSLSEDTHEAATVKRISSMSIVKSISPVRELHRPQRQVSTVGDGLFEREAQLGKRATPQDVYYPHVMTGVDKLHKQGYFGTGLRVAVVDSGIDYKHPALGGCFGKGCRVEFGYNLVDKTEDPYDNCDGHGTHVSGLLAAQANNPYNFTGVAPNVTLGHYKVMKCHGGSSTAIILEAFKRAFEDKADIITASLGLYSGWAEEPWGLLIEKIVKAGVPCTVAVGNNGQSGMFLSSNGIDNPAGTGVGSFNNLYSPMILSRGTYSLANGSTSEFGWSISGQSDFANGTYQLYPLSLNSSIVGDGCTPWTAKTDLSRKMVLIRRGGCNFQIKQDNAAKAGVKNILFYNDRPGVDAFEYKTPGLVGIGMVPTSTGAKWISAAATSNVTLHMVSNKYAKTIYSNEVNKQAGGQVSDFTEWGPSNQLLPVTTISAPGGFMLSTYPLALGGYAVESGTSMATPYMAGCIALMLEARGKVSPATIKALFAATSMPNVFHDGVSASPYLASVAQQGAGLINAYNAVHETTLLNVSSIPFNDTEHLAPAWIQISNTGNVTKLYTLGHTGAATVYTLSNNQTVPQTINTGSFMDRNTKYASIQFSKRIIRLSPGKSTVVKITASPPLGLEAARIPIYSGFITFNGTTDSLSIPYLGAATSMRNVTILDKMANYLTSSATKKRVKPNDLFVLPSPNGTAGAQNTSNPVFNVRPSMGTALLRVDVKANGSVVGQVAGFPKTYLPRSVDSVGVRPVQWTGQLAEGGFVAAGTYSLVVRALKIFGNPDVGADYDVVESERFRVVYAGEKKVKQVVRV
ncbi:subtilisin [Pochonia chlamydosporia 170]|uniref:Subtilisin n=1 Tax=Pochonia chlamydosporia 170 TaxID=1380566 RepID=A0A179F403_METCM|nr:subtilisin [Pochonia chlamydosporia 170]OAQ60157.1 subtilisin [Pochonia chlamydosporia 170]